MKKDFNQKPLKIFFSYIMGQKKLFAIDMFCALLVAVIDLVFPFVSRMSMNELLPKSLFKTFFVVMALMLLGFVFKSVLYYIITVVGHRMGVLVESDMRQDVFTHMQELSCSFYDKNRTGVLMSHITSDLFEVTELAHHGPENILICSLTILGALGVMYAIDWRLALVLTVLLPVCFWFTLSQRISMKKANVEVKRKTAEIYAAIESSISGIRTAKAFANEQREGEKFERANELFRSSKVEYYKAMGLFNSGMEFTTSAAQVAVIAVGGALIMRGEMNYVDLITFSLYVSAFVTPVRKLAQFAEIYMQGTAGFGRFVDIMRTEPAIKDAPDAVDAGQLRGDIEYKNVSFNYGNGVPVLDNVSLHISPGESFALVGPSGGGKTTLCQLLPRFYDVAAGSISIDGQDVRDVTQQSLRRAIGLVQQDVYLFDGTIGENIAYGKPGATAEEIAEAARRANIDAFIESLPQGYDTVVGERGGRLSGGQKQRVAIARVFLKNPKILILDEATSALDNESEEAVQESLEELARGRTTIIIAHRLSTIKHADEIATVEHGRVVERGTHEELLARGGTYARYYRMQFEGARAHELD